MVKPINPFTKAALRAQNNPGALKAFIGNPLPHDEINEAVTKDFAEYTKNGEFAKMISKYKYAEDEKPFKEQAIAYLNNAFEFTVGPDQITPTEGSHHGIFATVMAFAKPGEGNLLIPKLYYPSYTHVIEQLRLNQKLEDPHYPLNGNYGLDLAGIEAKLKSTPDPKCIIINYPHNPTGAMETEDNLKQLINLCTENNVKIINDCAYNEIIFDENHRPKLLSQLADDNQKDTVIDLISLSKSASVAGARIGFIVSSPDNIEAINKAKYAVQFGTPSLSLAVGTSALKKLVEGIKVKIRDPYIKLKGILLGELRGRFNSKLKDHLPVIPEGGLFAWLKIPGSFTDRDESGSKSEAYADKLDKEADIICIPGHPFGDDNFIRVSMCTKDEEEFREGVRRLAATMAS